MIEIAFYILYLSYQGSDAQSFISSGLQTLFHTVQRKIWQILASEFNKVDKGKHS